MWILLLLFFFVSMTICFTVTLYCFRPLTFSMSWFSVSNGTHKLVQYGTGTEVVQLNTYNII